MRLPASIFDLMTGLSRVPLRVFSMAGIGIALVSILVVILLLVKGLILGIDGGGTSMLLGILFFLVGTILLGIGLLGEYLGWIYEQSRARTVIPVREHLRPATDPAHSDD